MKLQFEREGRFDLPGQSLLRSIQNASLPLVELFVREAIQNSLDATLDGKSETVINIGTNTFDIAEMAKYFEGLNESENLRMSKNNKVIFLSDKNTSGLIGEIKDSENADLNESRIYKLVYGLGRAQQASGAGGSWGLGKTSFYRLGNGIVIYYTRVKLNNGLFEERMAANLIEDSTNQNAIFKNNKRGIAFWGEKEGDHYDINDYTYPITDTEKIHNILSIFGIKPYSNEETGTTIVIPFIDEEKISGHDNRSDDGENPYYWWTETLEDRIELAVQKWYAPRINNNFYREKYGSSLSVTINDEPFGPSDFQAFFKKVHQLYSMAITEGRLTFDSKIRVEQIILNSMALSKDSDKIIGDLAYCALDENELNMLPPGNESNPLEYFGISNESKSQISTKIIAYTRKPGMIVNYDIDGAWSSGVENIDNEVLLGIFVPRSNKKMHEVYQSEILYLDDYFRATEQADHSSWEDTSINNKKVTIVKRTQNDIKAKLKENYNDNSNKEELNLTSSLGRKLGNLLLPTQKKGRVAVNPGGKPRTESLIGRKIKTAMSINNISRNRNLLITHIGLEMKDCLEAELKLNIDMNTGYISKERWNRDMSTPFPFRFKSINILSKNQNEVQDNLDDFLSCSITDEDTIRFRHISNESNHFYAEIEVEVDDLLIQPSLNFKEV